MALIKKQIFRPSKDENLQQFLSKGDKGYMSLAEQADLSPKEIAEYESQANKKAKAKKSWPKDKPDPSGRDYPGEIEDREYQKAFEVDPKGGAKQYDQKERDAKRQRILDHSWKYVKDLEDQGSDNSNSADDRTQKEYDPTARKTGAGDKSGFRGSPDQRRTEKIEDQDYKDWQREQAASGKSKATIGDNVDPATIVTKAIQDAWLEKRGPVDRLTGGRVKFENKPEKQYDPKSVDWTGRELQVTGKDNKLMRGVASAVGASKTPTSSMEADQTKRATKAAGLDYAAKGWFSEAIMEALLEKADSPEDKPKTDTSVRERDVNYPNKRDGSIAERSKSFAESHTALYGGSPKRAAKRFRARLGRQVSSAEARRTREALPSDQRENITAASKKKQQEARENDPDERWASPRNNPNWHIRGERADIAATQEEVARQGRGDLTDAEIISRDWPLDAPKEKRVPYKEGEGAFRRMTPDQKAKYRRRTNLKKAVEDAYLEAIEGDEWVEKIFRRKPKTPDEKYEKDVERYERSKAQREAIGRGAKKVGSKVGEYFPTVDDLKAVKRRVERTGIRNPLYDKRSKAEKLDPHGMHDPLAEEWLRRKAAGKKVGKTPYEDKTAGGQPAPPTDKTTEGGKDRLHRGEPANLKISHTMSAAKKKSNFESGPTTPEEQYQADSGYNPKKPDPKPLFGGSTKKAIQGELIDMTSIQQAVYDAWFEKADASDADAAKGFRKIREDLKAKAAAEEQAEKDYKSSKDHSRYSRSSDVSETGGMPTPYKGPADPPPPLDRTKSKAELLAEGRGPNRPKPYKRDVDF